MEIEVAVDLLRRAVGKIENDGAVWADLGAGTGVFTRALARLLGAGATIYAVDDDPKAVATLRELSASSRDVRIVAVRANFAG